MDSLMIASQFAPGDTTTNSRTPYLQRKASRNRKREEEKEMLRKKTNINPSSSYRICNLKFGPIVTQIIQAHRSDMVEVRSWLWACMAVSGTSLLNLIDVETHDGSRSTET